MAELIRKPFYEKFMELCAESTHDIKLCAPFVKSNIINEIILNSRDNINLSLITNINLNSLTHKALDISALETLSNNNYHIKNAQNLHAKIYIFDDNKCAITSSNLSYSGLKNNIEYGIIIDDKYEIKKVLYDYNKIINNPLNGEITSTQITYLKKLLYNIPESRTHFQPDYSENFNEIINLNKSFFDANFTGWKKFIIDIIEDFDKDVFTRKDFKNIELKIRKYYPKSKTPLQTVSRVLQELRDAGLIKFEDRGIYKKLWKTTKK